MRWPCLILSVMVAGCAAGDGSWPSLGRRPGEAPPAIVCAAAGCATPAPDAATPGTVAAPDAAPPRVAIDSVPAQLAAIERELGDLATGLSAQRKAIDAAVAAARGAKLDSEPWARAQLELSRLDSVGTAIGDVRTRLDAVVATLDAAAGQGTDTAAPRATATGLIARADTLGADYRQAAATANAVIAH